MLIEVAPIVRTVRISPGVSPPETGYPHYRLIPVHTEAGKYHCLLFYVSAKDYLILEPKIKRHLAVKKLAEFLKTASFPVYEVTYGEMR